METFAALLAVCAGNLPVTGEFPSQSEWYGTLMLNAWVNNREVGDLRRHHDHYDVIVMRYVLTTALSMIYICKIEKEYIVTHLCATAEYVFNVKLLGLNKPRTK